MFTEDSQLDVMRQSLNKIIESSLYLYESFKVNVNTPEELLDWMDVFEYGWMDKSFKKHYDFKEWFDKAIIHLPEDIYKHKIGTCYEQTLFEYHVFSKQFPQYQLKMIHIQQYCVNNHAFLLFKKDDFWYYFEHSFAAFKGIYGPFNNVKQAVDKVKKFKIERSKKEGSYKNEGFRVTEMDPNKFKVRLTMPEFYERVNYNWNKSV